MRGAFGNLPCGEGFIAPLEGTAEGTLVVDGSIAGIGRVAEPVALTVRDGHLTEANGADGARLLELLTEHGPDGTNVAELGIGTNESAILTGNILEDEKILGTAHVAFGASAAIGGTVQVPVHLDCVVLRPDRGDRRRADRAGRRAARLSGGRDRCLPSPTSPRAATRRGSPPSSAPSRPGRTCSTATAIAITTAPSSRSPARRRRWRRRWLEAPPRPSARST